MYGRSVNFSPILDHCVRGGDYHVVYGKFINTFSFDHVEYIYPNQLTRSDLAYEYYEDFREGYLGNALINVSWNSSLVGEYYHVWHNCYLICIYNSIGLCYSL